MTHDDIAKIFMIGYLAGMGMGFWAGWYVFVHAVR